MVIQPKKRILLISSFLFKLDPSRQYLLLNNESIHVCSQVLNNLSNLLYAFSRIAKYLST